MFTVYSSQGNNTTNQRKVNKMFYQLREAYEMNRNQGLVGTPVRATKKLAKSTIKGYSFEKLAKHAHNYAKENNTDARGFAQVEFDGHVVYLGKEIRKELQYTVYAGFTAQDPFARKFLIQVIEHLYNN